MTTLGSRTAIAMALAAALLGCDRTAEIYDVPAPAVVANEGPRPTGPIPPVEADFTAPDLPACSERAISLCDGGTDFPCMPEVFMEPAIRDCFDEDGCRVDGWVEVELGDDGCAAELRMEDPNDEFVACMVERLAQGRCVCGAATLSLYMGLGNDGCLDDSGG